MGSLRLWLADDEAVNLPASLYEEFVAPYYPRIFREFGGGVLHFCGNGAHLAGILRKMEGLKAINTGPMGRPELQQGLGGIVPLIYQEMAPDHPERYYGELMRRISLRGVVFASAVCDRLAIGDEGGLVEFTQDRRRFAKTVFAALKQEIVRSEKATGSASADDKSSPADGGRRDGPARPPG